MIQSEPTDTELFHIGRLLHEARMKECYGSWTHMPSRYKWPETEKEYRGQQQTGQPHIDIAIAQVKAIWHLLKPNMEEFL